MARNVVAQLKERPSTPMHSHTLMYTQTYSHSTRPAHIQTHIYTLVHPVTRESGQRGEGGELRACLIDGRRRSRCRAGGGDLRGPRFRVGGHWVQKVALAAPPAFSASKKIHPWQRGNSI